MANKIVWSDNAQRTFDNTLDYIQKEWSQKEVASFISLVYSKLEVLKSFPKIGACVKKGFYKTVLRKRIILIYNYSAIKEEITLVIFWNTQQNPNDLKF